MRIFVTGASGFVGSAIVPELIKAGHRVVGLARSDRSASAVEAMGAEVFRGTIDDPEGLARGAEGADGVIHTAYNHEFVQAGDDTQKAMKLFVESGETDRKVVEALGRALEGSGRPLVITSGLGGIGTGKPRAETDPPSPSPRAPSEDLMGEYAGRGVRTSVIRLSPSVHGAGDYGFVPILIKLAREKGASAYVGEGANRWPAVHRLDAAKLYRLAVEKGEPGSTFHGVAEVGVPFRQVAEAIGRGLGVPVVAKSADEAGAHFGWLAHFAALDMPASNDLTRQTLGWEPTGPGLIADMAEGHYFAG